MDSKAIIRTVILLSVSAYVIAYVGWGAVTGLANGGNSTITSKSFNASSYGTYLGNVNLVSGSEQVSNTTNPFFATDNYTINYNTGIITLVSGKNLVNGTSYSISYRHGEVDSGVSTLGKIVVAIVFFLAVILIVLTKILGFEVL